MEGIDVKIEQSDLLTVGMVINEPGVKLFENIIKELIRLRNDVTRISGDVFQDGILRGQTEGLKTVLIVIKDIREQLKTLNKENDDG